MKIEAGLITGFYLGLGYCDVDAYFSIGLSLGPIVIDITWVKDGFSYHEDGEIYED